MSNEDVLKETTSRRKRVTHIRRRQSVVPGYILRWGNLDNLLAAATIGVRLIEVFVYETYDCSYVKTSSSAVLSAHLRIGP